MSDSPINAPPPSSIMQIVFTVRDLEAAKAFYGGALGLPLLMEFPGLAFYGCGSTRLMLSAAGAEKPETPKPSDATVVYFRIEELPAMCAALRAKGIELNSEPGRVARLPDHDLWLASVRDPSGNLLGLMSEARPPAAE